MYCVRAQGILLRDMVESDIADYLRWETVETEWQLWDAPWMYEGRSAEQCAQELREYRQTLERRVDEATCVRTWKSAWTTPKTPRLRRISAGWAPT